jgi:hypothetical protein
VSSGAQQGRSREGRCFTVDLAPQFRYRLEPETDPTPRREPTTLRLQAPVTAFADGLTQLAIEWPDRDSRTTIEGPTTAQLAVLRMRRLQLLAVLFLTVVTLRCCRYWPFEGSRIGGC